MAAIICDLDGLLVDSEPIHFQAYKTVLGELGIEIDQQMFIDDWLSGKHYGTRYHLEQAGYDDPELLKRLRDKKSDVFCEMAKGRLKTMSGVKEFLEKAREKGIPCGVGTGGYHQEYMFSLQECGILDYFQVMVGGNEVEHNKPEPDIFLQVAEKLGAKPNESAVFENSNIGLHAALNANMHCIVIPSPFTKEQDFSGAHEVLSTIEDVNLDQLFSSK